MNSRSLSMLAIFGFLLVGGICLGLRYRALSKVATARDESQWRLTYNLSFEATTDPTTTPPVPTQVWLAQPFDTRYCEVSSRNRAPWSSIHPELKFYLRRRAFTRTREILISTTQPKKYAATATFDLLLSSKPTMSREPQLERMTGDARSFFLKSEDFIPVSSAAVQAAVDALPDNAVTEAERTQAIFDYCANIETPDTGESLDDAAVALSRKSGSALARARAMVAMCRAERIPARLVTGFEVKQQSKAIPHVWVEAFWSQRWVPYDPESGYTQTLPHNYVPVRRGGDSVERGVLTKDLQATYSIVRLPPDERVFKVDEQHPIRILDLTRLPVPMHTVMKILLLLPFAALITTGMRNVIGLQTFGTFSPALLAMSFIYADWKTGILILLIVIAVGLFGRAFLERLRLLMVPRLSIILTMVILSVVFTVSALNYLLPGIRGDAVLLPMVIVTMLIERFHVSVDEDGLIYTLHLAVGTLLVALLCYAVLGWQSVGNFVLQFPETHFFTIAAFVVLGRYAGYRLTELWRFRDLVDTTETVR